MESALQCTADNGRSLHSTRTNQTYYITADNFKTPVGKGAFGTILLATSNQMNYAIKLIAKNSTLPKELIKREIEYMFETSKIKGSANIIYALDMIEDNQFIYLVMPYYEEGTLTSLINKGAIRSERDAIEYFRQICYGIIILHSMNTIHRDIKTDNILATKNTDSTYPLQYYLAVADLGLAKAVSNINESTNTIKVGTCFTMAPEVNTNKYGEKVDIFSLGCILYKMLTKVDPYNGVSREEIFNLKKKETLDIRSCFTTPISDFTLGLLEDCLQYEPSKRISSNDLSTKLKLGELYTNYTPLTSVFIQKQTIRLNRPTNEIKQNISYSISQASSKKEMSFVKNQNELPIMHKSNKYTISKRTFPSLLNMYHKLNSVTSLVNIPLKLQLPESNSTRSQSVKIMPNNLLSSMMINGSSTSQNIKAKNFLQYDVVFPKEANKYIQGLLNGGACNIIKVRCYDTLWKTFQEFSKIYKFFSEPKFDWEKFIGFVNEDLSSNYKSVTDFVFCTPIEKFQMLQILGMMLYLMVTQNADFSPNAKKLKDFEQRCVGMYADAQSFYKLKIISLHDELSACSNSNLVQKLKSIEMIINCK